MSNLELKKTLGPFMLWGLGVGYVISGMYFGWNLGLEKGGTLGLGIATLFVILMYFTFTFSYTELACSIPKAGGAFSYAQKAFGKNFGFLGGMAQNIEFIFAPPAIAIAIGSYLAILLESNGLNIDYKIIAIVAYIIFTYVNVRGVKIAATFELIITLIAVVELLIFFGASAPDFELNNVTRNYLPENVGLMQGIFSSIPFAIWFFLAIEGVANVAEETINPQRNILIGFGSALFTLIILCLLTFFLANGANGWEAIVYEFDINGNILLDSNGEKITTDSPLPKALAHIYGEGHWLYHLVTSIGLFGLVASFHGILLAGGRSTFEFGRQKFAPSFLGSVHTKFYTPSNALIFNSIIGIIAILTGKTGEIITIAVMGALTLYIISMLSNMKLRIRHPEIDRPFKVPLFPITPLIALFISTISLIAVFWYNPKLALIYVGLLSVSYAWFYVNEKK